MSQINQIKRELLRLMTSKTGIDGLLALLTDLAEDLGDGKLPGQPQAHLSVDPFWKEVSAILDVARTQVATLTSQQR